MRLLNVLRRLTTRQAKAMPAASLPVTDLSDAEDREYVDEVNARAAATRAERAAVLAALLGGRPRWVPRRGRGWLS